MNPTQPQPAKPKLYIPIRVSLEGVFNNADENCYLDFRPPTMPDYIELEKVFEVPGMTEARAAQTPEEVQKHLRSLAQNVKMDVFQKRVNFVKKFFVSGQHKDQDGNPIVIDTSNVDQVLPYCFKRVQRLLFPPEVESADFTNKSVTQ